MKPTGVRLILALLLLVLALPLAASAQLMIIGNDEKVTWDDAGTRSLLGPGKDTISIVDISTPEAPRIVTNLPLTNSIFGPPVNLAITPDGRLALVAKSVEHVPDGAGWKFVPDDKVYVIDLTTTPPSHIATVDGGQAALRPGHQPGREPGAGDEPGRQLHQRAGHPGEGREIGGHGAHGRPGGGRGLHPGRQARAGGEVPRPQGGAAWRWTGRR